MVRSKAPQDYEYDVAISYASEDRSFAEALASALKIRGIRVFYDQYEKPILWGKDLYVHLSEIYQHKACYCIPLFSAHYVSKLWTKHELRSAQARALHEAREYILPVRLDQSDIPGILPTVSYLSWPPETAEAIAHALMEKMNGIVIEYEELRVEATQYLNDKKFSDALTILNATPLSQAPAQQRWRLIALRGQAYFEQRKFMKAQQDFFYAVSEGFSAASLPIDQQQELLHLHLHLAETHRALQQYEEAREQYAITLQMVNSETPAGYAAEVNWGMSLVVLEVNKKHTTPEYTAECRKRNLYKALEHAENARFLYRSIGEQLRAAAITCQAAHIEQMLGDVERARTYLESVLTTWPSCTKSSSPDIHSLREEANVISAAACSLAEIELEARNFAAARSYVDQALEASHKTYKLRRADAYVMLGRILEAINPKDPGVAESFYCATQELADTHRIAARISAHVRLGHHLLRIGKIEEGEQELEQAHYLSSAVSF